MKGPSCLVLSVPQGPSWPATWLKSFDVVPEDYHRKQDSLSVAAEGPPKDRPKRGGSIAHAPALCTVEEDAPLRKMDTVDDPEHCFLHHSAAPQGFSLQRGRLGFRNTGNGHCPDPSLVLFLFPSLSLSSPHELYVTTVRGTLRGHHGQPLVIVQK